MTIPIDKAIERLKNLAIHHHNDTFHENEDAIQLGIEALKCIKTMRDEYLRPHCSHLPGEAEEGD